MSKFEVLCKDGANLPIDKLVSAYYAAGNRIIKKVKYTAANAAKNNLTRYSRDAAGNTMAVV